MVHFDLKKMILPVVLVFILSLQDCQPLKCFQCNYETINGKHSTGKPECDGITSSTTNSDLLRECTDPEKNKLCFYLIHKAKSEGNDIYSLHRACGSKAKLGCHPVKYMDGLPDATACYCDKDACNVGRSTATTVTGHSRGLLHLLIIPLLAQCHDFLPL